MPEAPEASVILLLHDSAAVLPACLDGLRRQRHADFELVVVDNASADGGADVARRRWPGALVVRQPANAGYAAGCNAGFRRARGGCLAVLGPDCEPEPGWLGALVAACRERGAGLATSMVRRADDRDRVNACGNDVHVLGLGLCRGLDEPWRAHARPAVVAAVSGCAFAMPRRVYERIGGFDEDFFMYCEDTDLSLRAWLAGYRVVTVPGSVCYHRYRPDVGPQKFFHLERNRHLVLLGCLELRSLAALAPALLAGEALAWAYAARRGPAFLAAKAGAWRWLLAHGAAVRERRARAAALRCRGDGLLLGLMTARLPGGQVPGAGVLGRAAGALAGACFAATLRLARRLAR